MSKQKTEVPIEKRDITAEEIKQLRPYTKKQIAYLWGRRRWTTPTLVHTVFGDGKQLISLDPTNSRPDYYVMLADSSIKSLDDAADFIANNEELVFQAIEEEYGNFDDGVPERGRWGKRGKMALNISSGYTAGFYEDFKLEQATQNDSGR